MKWIAWAKALGVAVALTSAPSIVHAEPRSQLWEFRTTHDRELHREATRLYTQYTISMVANTFGSKLDFAGILIELTTKLEAAGVQKSDDWELRLDYAFALHALDHYESAIAIFETTLPKVPRDEPRLASGYFDLAIEYAKTQRRDKEIESYMNAIALEKEPEVLSNAYSNLSEAHMSMNELEKARAMINKSLEFDPHNVLAEWNRAIIVDRQGNDADALYFTSLVLTDDPDLVYLNSPNVFFEPPYEYAWYRALAEWTKATLEPAEEKAHLEHARLAFHEFMLRATPSSPFFARALDHWRTISTRLAQLAKPKPTK